MKKRGPIILIAGAIMMAVSFSIGYSVVPSMQSGLNGQDRFAVLESMFDNVSEKVTIDAGNAYSFQYTSKTGNVPLMWGMVVTDYTQGDSASITVSNIFGDKFGTFSYVDPVLVKSFIVPKADTYNFNVQNNGKNSITVEMLFTENPEKSKALTDPNSPFAKDVVPILVAGLVLIVGFALLIAGLVLTVMDWRRGKNQSRYL